MKIIAQVVIGYMYKVLKNKKDISMFHKEFASIRHGDYEGFLNLIGDEIEFIVSYNSGLINTVTAIREDDSDFGRLVKSGESLKTFQKKCQNEFGIIEDDDLEDDIFEKLALFELALRMQINNKGLKVERIVLENVINQLKVIKKLSDSECESLHKGRQFLNKVKHPETMKSNWGQGKEEFIKAYTVLKSKQLTIV